MKLEFANTPAEILPVLKQQLESFGARVIFDTPFSGRVDSIAGKLHFVHTGQTLTISLLEDQSHFAPALLLGGIKQMVGEALELVQQSKLQAMRAHA